MSKTTVSNKSTGKNRARRVSVTFRTYVLKPRFAKLLIWAAEREGTTPAAILEGAIMDRAENLLLEVALAELKKGAA